MLVIYRMLGGRVIAVNVESESAADEIVISWEDLLPLMGAGLLSIDFSSDDEASGPSASDEGVESFTRGGVDTEEERVKPGSGVAGESCRIERSCSRSHVGFLLEVSSASFSSVAVASFKSGKSSLLAEDLTCSVLAPNKEASLGEPLTKEEGD